MRNQKDCHSDRDLCAYSLNNGCKLNICDEVFSIYRSMQPCQLDIKIFLENQVFFLRYTATDICSENLLAKVYDHVDFVN